MFSFQAACSVHMQCRLPDGVLRSSSILPFHPRFDISSCRLGWACLSRGRPATPVLGTGCVCIDHMILLVKLRLEVGTGLLDLLVSFVW